jgi:hypothetical protein
MFLDKKYILANELVQKMGIHIANISMIAKSLEDYDDVFVKMGNCTFINTESIELPNNLKEAIAANDFTDMSDKIPVTFIKAEHNLSVVTMKKSGIISEVTEIAGKKFYVFKKDFMEKTKDTILYVLDKEETSECAEKNYIDGYTQIGTNKFLTWYNVGIN